MHMYTYKKWTKFRTTHFHKINITNESIVIMYVCIIIFTHVCWCMLKKTRTHFFIHFSLSIKYLIFSGDSLALTVGEDVQFPYLYLCIRNKSLRYFVSFLFIIYLFVFFCHRIRNLLVLPPLRLYGLNRSCHKKITMFLNLFCFQICTACRCPINLMFVFARINDFSVHLH